MKNNKVFHLPQDSCLVVTAYWWRVLVGVLRDCGKIETLFSYKICEIVTTWPKHSNFMSGEYDSLYRRYINSSFYNVSNLFIFRRSLQVMWEVFPCVGGKLDACLTIVGNVSKGIRPENKMHVLNRVVRVVKWDGTAASAFGMHDWDCLPLVCVRWIFREVCLVSPMYGFSCIFYKKMMWEFVHIQYTPRVTYITCISKIRDPT